MDTVKGWKDLDATLVGLVFLQALLNLGKGRAGYVDVDLGGKWVRIVVDPSADHLVISPIAAVIELVDVVEEG